MDGLIGVFLYDIISRIVPGLIVLSLYCRWMLPVFGKLKEDSVTLVLFATIPAAWLAGIIVDVAVIVPFAIVFSNLKRALKGQTGKAWRGRVSAIVSMILLDPDPEEKPGGDPERTATKQALRSKGFAERIMTRTLATICIAVTIWPPQVIPGMPVAWEIVGLFGFTAFSLAWLYSVFGAHRIPLYAIVVVILAISVWIWL